MNKGLDPNQYSGLRGALRVMGPLVVIVGVIFMIVGFVDFFGAMNSRSFGGPRLFWCFFVGMPLIAIGGAMTKFAYLGSIFRYISGETSPVARDTFNYIADGTTDSIKNIATAVGSGLREVGVGGRIVIRCHKCNAENPADAKFCNRCGAELGKTIPCPECNELNDPDARFCDNCGKPMDPSSV